MNKLIFVVCFLVSIQIGKAQNSSIDNLLTSILHQKDDNARIDSVKDFFSNTAESDPLLDLKNSQKLLAYAESNNDKIVEVLALTNIGYDYRTFGNREKSLAYILSANEKAQEIGNQKLVAIVSEKLGHYYKDLGNYAKAISLYMSVVDAGKKLDNFKLKIWGYENLTEVYLAKHNIDTALMYAQKDYELCMRFRYLDFIGYTLVNLGNIQSEMKNNALAISYFDMAIQEGIKIKSSKLLGWAYSAKATYFNDLPQRDSSIVYAKKAIATFSNSTFINFRLYPAKLLLNIYRETNIDSAFKYSEMYRIANDSMFSAKSIQQSQLMAFEDNLHQQEIVAGKLLAAQQKKLNLQYIFIAIGIITMIMLYLLLSRSFITNAKYIEFFGVIALLIVFEFLNLLLHPFIESVTHHSPLLTLLGLVCIAALLVPLHHKVEKWATAKLVEKNKRIRLAIAKKTIEKLSETTNSN